MTKFQWIGIALITLPSLFIVFEIIIKRRLRAANFFWLTFWLVVGGALLWHEKTAILAQALGIGRGVDLVIYTAILGACFGFFLIYIRFKVMEAKMTKLVRHLAIQEQEFATRLSQSEAP